jgi:GTP-dependent phosphoenolpyruvate carboxykinase
MGDWFIQEEKKAPFELANQNPNFSKRFNDAMVSANCLFSNVIVKHGGDIFWRVYDPLLMLEVEEVQWQKSSL